MNFILYVVQVFFFLVFWCFIYLYSFWLFWVYENLKNIKMIVKLFCFLKIFLFIYKCKFGIYVRLNYEIKFNEDEEEGLIVYV